MYSKHKLMSTQRQDATTSNPIGLGSTTHKVKEPRMSGNLPCGQGVEQGEENKYCVMCIHTYNVVPRVISWFMNPFNYRYIMIYIYISTMVRPSAPDRVTKNVKNDAKIAARMAC